MDVTFPSHRPQLQHLRKARPHSASHKADDGTSQLLGSLRVVRLAVKASAIRYPAHKWAGRRTGEGKLTLE